MQRDKKQLLQMLALEMRSAKALEKITKNLENFSELVNDYVKEFSEKNFTDKEYETIAKQFKTRGEADAEVAKKILLEYAPRYANVIKEELIDINTGLFNGDQDSAMAIKYYTQVHNYVTEKVKQSASNAGEGLFIINLAFSLYGGL